MSEVTRYSEGRCGFGTEHPQGCWVLASDFDRVTAERDAALAQESTLARDAANWKRKACESADREHELQQRLTAADERADVLEGLLRDSKDVMSGIWDTSYDHEAGDALAALDLMERIDAALKPAEGGGDEN